MSSSVGLMTFPTEWKSKIHHPNHQPIDEYCKQILCKHGNVHKEILIFHLLDDCKWRMLRISWGNLGIYLKHLAVVTQGEVVYVHQSNNIYMYMYIYIIYNTILKKNI